MKTTTLNKLVKREVSRILSKNKYANIKTPKIKVVGIQFDENFTSVVIQKKSKVFVGHAKCNPNYDSYDEVRGVKIALARALELAIVGDSNMHELNLNVG